MALITSSSPSTLPDFVDAYYAQKPNFADLASSDSESEGDEEPEHEKETEKEEKEGVFAEKSLEDALKDLELHPEVFGTKTLKDFRKGFKRKEKMPAHPAEEYAGGNITDQVAKDSSDSTASTHPRHQEGTGATSGGSLGAMAHKANPGPVMAENIGKPESKEALKARAEELNK
jgi:hypothetical protein